MSNRERHRQGVAYGPVRPPGRRDRGAILGNLLGLVVIVVTVGVLATGIYIFLQSRNAGPLPTATVAATISPVASILQSPAPTPSPLPTLVASLAPTALPSVEATVAPSAPITPAPTIFVPLVQVGPGYVTFGTDFDSQLHIIDPRSTFRVDEHMAWSAYLTEQADSADLRIRILKLDPQAPNGQRLIREDEVKPAAHGTQVFLRRLRPIGASEGPGMYTVEYVRGDQVLSVGSFLVLEA